MELALIGFGAIGQHVFNALQDDDNIRISTIVEHPDFAAAAQEKVGDGVKVVTSVDSLVASPPDLIVEVAGHAGLKLHGLAVLKAGLTMLLVSSGALSDRALYDELAAAASEGGGKMLIAAGAVGGIDALAAARQGGIDVVRYTSRKPPLAWKGTPGEEICDLDALTEETVLFEGAADEAARLYPKNANVAATIALAGAGWDDTRVRVIADPHAPGNVHEIEVEGTFGTMSVRMIGKPLPDNPKTSSLTAYSVLRAIRNRSAAVEI
jgi:aspartate dehydrogenase